MKAEEFFDRLPIVEKVRLAGLVIERWEMVPDSASDQRALDAHDELKGLAIEMLESAIADLKNPRRYR